MMIDGFTNADNGGQSRSNRPFENTRCAVAAEIAAAAKNDPVTQVALPQEASLAMDRNILMVYGPKCKDEKLRDNFFGSVLMVETPFVRVDPARIADKIVYLCGDMSWSRSDEMKETLKAIREGFIIPEISDNIGSSPTYPFAELGRVPISVQHVGVLFRHFFDANDLRDAFQKIQEDHNFQPLQDATRPDSALPATGVALTPVRRSVEGDLQFHLLRNSTKFSGPTENFKATDHYIVDALNQEAARIFDNQASLNHVVAQIYWDKQSTPNSQKMASEKTKDMPTNGIIAFSTFYDKLESLQRNSEQDPYDWVNEGNSGLTKMRFKLKDQVMQRGSPLIGQFDVTLYPDSVFFMPLSTNRLYKHQILPSPLSSGSLPTPIRMGYIVRCSSTEALHKEGKTFIQKPGSGKKRTWEELEQEPPEAEVKRLKSLYEQEDDSEKHMDYGGKFRFSMNSGDYREPDYNIRDEFRVFNMDQPVNLYNYLHPTVAFEDVAPGRKAAVLVHPDPNLGIPIVRSTTKLENPAQFMQTIHLQCAGDIRLKASLKMPLNNCLVELFDNQYDDMAFHSEQAQDLAEDSHIVLFSCYENPDVLSRKLVVESKIPGEGGFEIPLAQHSFVVWSLETNSRFRHKIVLDKSQGEPPENTWLGFTFRTSSTCIQYRQEEGESQTRAYFSESGMPLVLLEGDLACSPIYKLRKMENAATEFKYPAFLSSTISRSDLKPPIDGTRQPIPRSRRDESAPTE